MKQRIYIDTSVYGGFYDAEFEEYTKPLFERIKNKDLRIMYSSVTEKELEKAPEKVKQLIRSLPSDITEFIEVTEDIVDRIRGYNSVNIKLGYSTIDIRSPREFMKYEN